MFRNEVLVSKRGCGSSSEDFFFIRTKRNFASSLEEIHMPGEKKVVTP